MPVVVVGISHRSAPVGVLERVTIREPLIPKALDDLISRQHLDEVVVLATCQRTEVYVAAERFHGAVEDTFDFLSNHAGVALDSLGELTYSKYDDDALRHLFSVATGLDSTVLGETEVLGQLRDAWQLAQDLGVSGPVLGRAFGDAIAVGRKARSSTGIARGTTSLGHAAVELVANHFGSLEDKHVAVVGAGQMGTSVVRNARDFSAGVALSVVNRSRERADVIAEPIGADVFGLGQLLTVAKDVDALVTTLATDTALLDSDDLVELQEQRGGRPLLIVDMGLPRNIAAGANDIAGLTLVQLEQLAQFASQAVAERQSEVPAVEALIETALSEHQSARKALDAAPLIAALRARAEQIRVEELSKTSKKLTQLTESDRAALDAMTQAIINKLLHEPTSQLRAAASNSDAEALMRAINDLFDLKP